MRKFKLKKDLPGIPAGTVLELADDKFTGYPYLYTAEGQYIGLALYRGTEGRESLNYLTDDTGISIDDWAEWLEELEPDGGKRGAGWRAELGGHYYYIKDTGNLSYSMDNYWDQDTLRYELGNYFASEEEARAHVDCLRALAVVRRDAKGYQPNWACVQEGDELPAMVCYKYSGHGGKGGLDWMTTDHIQLGDSDVHGPFGLPYFGDIEGVYSSMEKHEKEWKIIFGIKDDEDNEGESDEEEGKRKKAVPSR